MPSILNKTSDFFRTGLLMLMLKVMIMMKSSSNAFSTAPVVNAPWGRVQGVVLSGLENRTLHGFLGIPYALPPVGDLRFEKPRPHPGPGDGQTFLAEKVAPACIQEREEIGKERQLSEDCLVLDIYVPSSEASALRPVMFYIHGGGFGMGDSSSYSPSRLVVDEDVVVVVIQYRLGFFGFLGTSDGSLTPNLGLWDQNLALTWVRDNIAAFGGDPDLVTIFGQSAGSVNVGLQTLSPHSKGLFKRAILLSGSPSANLKVGAQLTPDLFDRFAHHLGCSESSLEKTLACIKKLPADRAQALASEFQRSLPQGFGCGPVVDGDFIPAKASEVLENEEMLSQSSLEDVETIIGFTDQEGAFIIALNLLANLSEEVVTSAQFFYQNVYTCLALSAFKLVPILAKTTAFHYLSENYEEERVDLQATANMYGDCLLTAPIIDWALQLAARPRTAPRYVYVMEHQFAFNKNGPLPGSHHGDDLALLFDLDQIHSADSIFALMNKTSLSLEDKPLSATFSKLLTSFARSGTPDFESAGKDRWPQFNKDSQQILSLSAAPRIVNNLGRYKAKWLLWKRLLPELQKQLSGSENSQDTDADGKEEIWEDRCFLG